MAWDPYGINVTASGNTNHGGIFDIGIYEYYQ
jgi:hypothetical protein